MHHNNRLLLKKTLVIAFRIVLILVVLELGLRASGYTHMFFRELGNKIDMDYDVVIVVDGDSMSTGKDSWPSQLQKMLDNNSNITYKVINKAKDAGTSTDVLGRAEENIEKYQPDIYVTMTGILDEGEAEDPGFLEELRIVKLFRRADRALIEGVRNEIVAVYAAEQYPIRIVFNQSNQPDPEASKLIDEAVQQFDRGNYEQAEQLLLKAVETDEKSEKAYLILAQIAKNEKDKNKMKYYANKLLEINRKNTFVFLVLGEIAYNEGDCINTIGNFENFIRSWGVEPGDPDALAKFRDPAAYEFLGKCYYLEGNYSSALWAIRNFLAFDDKEEFWAYLGGTELFLGKEAGADAAFRKLNLKYPNSPRMYLEMGYYYLETGMNDKFNEMFDGLEREDAHMAIKAYSALGERYQMMNRTGLADEFFNRTMRLRKGYSSDLTRNNYLRLYDLSRQNGIKMVAVQYPTLDVEKLRAYFDGEDVEFVSNEENFASLLRDHAYDEIFKDHEHGSFGHCTALGNRLIAEQVYKAIVD